MRNFTLPLARRSAQVTGVEGEAGLVRRAGENARRNGIANAQFFAADLAAIGVAGDAAYDRAALVALPPEMRGDYVRVLRSLLAPHATLLLVSLEFDAAGGPPFSVDDAEVRSRARGAEITELSADDVSSDAPRIRERGATRIVERSYAIRLG